MVQDPGQGTGTGEAICSNRAHIPAPETDQGDGCLHGQHHRHSPKGLPRSLNSPDRYTMTQTEHEGCAPLPTPESTASYWHKEPSKILLNHRTTKDLPSVVDVVVVGSGIVGAFAGWRLLHDGQSDELSGARKNVQGVLMLEAREACWGATGRVGCLSLSLGLSLGHNRKPVRSWLLSRRMIG